jgi:hypothetical protein
VFRVKLSLHITAGSIAPQRREIMSRLSRYAALAAFTAVVASSGAYAATHHNGGSRVGAAQNSVSDTDIRTQCYEEARRRWPSTSQDMQTNRDFAYRTCAFDRGLSSP